MAALIELKGTALGSETVRIDRGAVRVFARSVKDAADAYDGDDALVPPTFPFSWSYTGTLGREGNGGPGGWYRDHREGRNVRAGEPHAREN